MLIDDLRNNTKISLKEKIETKNSIHYSFKSLTKVYK